MSAPRQDLIGYAGVHRRLTVDRGPASAHTCECGEPAEEWAYDHADPDELIDTTNGYSRPFSLDQLHYEPKCVACHRRDDNLGSCRKGHEFTEENTYTYRGSRRCRTCRKENMRNLRER